MNFFKFRKRRSAVVEYLEKTCPESTEEERQRFAMTFCSKSKDRREQNLCAMVLIEYLDWRKAYGLDHPNNNNSNNNMTTTTTSEEEEEAKLQQKNKEDAKFWKNACAVAMTEKEKEKRTRTAFVTPSLKNFGKKIKKKKKKKKGEATIKDLQEEEAEEEEEQQQQQQQQQQLNNRNDSEPLMPQFCFHPNYLDTGKPYTGKNGKSLFLVLPAIVDKYAASSETYGLALALYLDNYFSRHSMETSTVLIDVRAGEGWPNRPISELISFIRRVVAILHKYHPERVDQALIFPVPKIALTLWKMIKPILPSAVASRATLVPGDDSWDAPMPYRLKRYLTQETMDLIEQRRQEAFVHDRYYGLDGPDDIQSILLQTQNAVTNVIGAEDDDGDNNDDNNNEEGGGGEAEEENSLENQEEGEQTETEDDEGCIIETPPSEDISESDKQIDDEIKQFNQIANEIANSKRNSN